MKLAAQAAVRRGAFLHRLADLAELTKLRLSLLVLLTVAVGFLAAQLTGMAGAGGGLALFGALAGVALCAAGSGALNQYLERDLDARMERTKARPIVAGRIAPECALLFGASAAASGVLVLDALCSRLAAGLGLASVVLYVLVYTPLKRVTTFNTLVGALVGALPPMIGWVAATGRIDRGAWLLFAILFVWQLPHFLAIAWLHRDDYKRAGMRMLGVDDPGGRVTMRQVLLFTLAMIPVSLMPAVNGMAGTVYFFVALALGLGLLACGACLVKSRTQESARRMFLASLVYLPSLLALLLIDAVR